MEGNIKNSFINILLENANHAPSHKLTQPWFFKVYKGESKDIQGDKQNTKAVVGG